jgi:hypothetical protein
MQTEVHNVAGTSPARQTGKLLLRLGEDVSLEVSVEIGSVGILSIGALVAGILLSSAVIVRAAIRK